MVNQDSVKTELNKIIKNDGIEISVISENAPDTLIPWIVVHIINPKNLPKNKDSLTVMQKTIAIKLMSLLNEPHEFKTYDILFMYKKGNWIHMTEGISFEHVFHLKEISK